MHRLGYLSGEQKECSSSKSRECLLLVVVIKMYLLIVACSFYFHIL